MRADGKKKLILTAAVEIQQTPSRIRNKVKRKYKRVVNEKTNSLQKVVRAASPHQFVYSLSGSTILVTQLL